MKILLLLALSIVAGLLLRNVRQLSYLRYTSTWTVWALLLVFGITLGGDDTIVGNFIHYGFTAFVVAIAGVAGSVLAAWCVSMVMDNKRRQ